ncbi:MAG: methyltransferase domain-containing protein [Nitrospirota bacterium]|nr:methyltransferase domain-containing protein [Nitrospirota bacterium]
MHVQFMNSLEPLSKPAQSSATQNVSSRHLRDSNPHTLQSWVPLSFNCRGGNWEGHIQQLTTGLLEVRLQGWPPVHGGEAFQFQYFDQHQPSHTQLHTGIIQRVQSESGASPWEGTTRMVVEPSLSYNMPIIVKDHKKGFSSKVLGSFVLGRVLTHEACESCDTDSQTHVRVPPAPSSVWGTNIGTQEPPQLLKSIQSTPLSIQKSDGHVIRAYHDYPLHADLSTFPVVVIAPGYGETKRDYLTLAYYFVSNGFHVIRYDHTNHVGESEGRHFESSLSSMKEDFQSVTQFARRQWPHSPALGVASSLAARVALKAEAEQASLNLLVMLVGVVDVQRSVATVHQEDVFDNYFHGPLQDSANILGFNVGRHFLEDALANKFSTLATTLEDVQALKTPVLYVAAGKDAWIDRLDLQAFKQSIGSRLVKWLDVPEALHRLQENPKIARTTYRQILHSCREFLGNPSNSQTLQEPNRVELGRQNRREKIFLQQQSHTDVGHAFWNDYLGHFHSVGKCQDYVQLLDHVFHALGPVTPGQRFLDAGCGNGNAGLFLLQSLQGRNIQPHRFPNPPIRYVGIDIIDEALRRAQAQMTQAAGSQRTQASGQCPSVHMSWAKVDLQYQLPFADQQFDRIVSNLVLGYVADPLAALREFYRVLAPGGRMVISNLKPNGDFSGIYQNLVNQAGQPEQKAEARELLHNYGKIRQAEKEGQFRFFDQTEWMKALDSLDCVHAGVYPTFANQALLIVLEKPAVLSKKPLVPVSGVGVIGPLNGMPHILQNVA